MSKYVINQGCEMCKKHECALTTMTVGSTKHHICYECMAEFASDVAQFAEMNCKMELNRIGVNIKTEIQTPYHIEN